MNFGDRRLPDRFWRKCSPEPNTGCWLWLAATCKGYGKISDGTGALVYAHRASYQALVGPIPPGLHIDHRVCRTPLCVNPAHLEPVSNQENNRRSFSKAGVNARKTHCLRGHAFDEANTYRNKDGRSCRACHREREREKRNAERARRPRLSVAMGF